METNSVNTQDATVNGTLKIDNIEAKTDGQRVNIDLLWTQSVECMGVNCSTVTANTIVSDGAFTYMANKTNFGDTLQGAALNGTQPLKC